MLINVDGFDYYPTADIPKKWTASYTDVLGNLPTIVAQGRFGTGTGAAQMGGFGVAGLAKNINIGVAIVGFAFKTSISTLGNILTLSNKNGYTQSALMVNNGVLSYTNGTRGTYTGTSSVPITLNTWNYVEVKCNPKASALAGENQVRLNGVVVIDVPAGTNTIGDSIYNAMGITSLLLAGGYRISNNVVGVNGALVYYDDFYLADNTGSVNNDFLGDIRIETIYPTAAGDVTQFTPTTGANWQCVSETPENGDTSYVAGVTPGTKDLYQVNDLSTNPTLVHGIQISTIARKDDAGNRVISPIVKSGGVEYDHTATNAFGLADGYTLHLDLWETNPNGNVLWTGSTINAMQLGIKVVT